MSAYLRFVGLIGHPEFRWIWLAGVQSQMGDQLARVALSLMTFAYTSSAVLTAGVYALTMLPALLGGVLLAPLADRLPRKAVVVWCDGMRALVLAAMAVPVVPLYLVCVLLVLAVMVGSPFQAAEPSLVRDVLEDDAAYSTSVGLRSATNQAAQLAGFGAGGFVVAAIGARASLALDAATFAISAALLAWAVRYRVAAHRAGSTPGFSAARSWLVGLRVVFGDPALRVLVGFACLVGLYVVPEGLAVPYAAATSHPAWAVGVLLAALPTGSLLGSLVMGVWVPPSWRQRWLAPLAALAPLPLIACWAMPGLWWAVSAWAATGALSAYQVQVVVEFTTVVPNEVRGHAVGLASTAMLAAQGVGLIVGGALAVGLGSPGRAIGTCGMAALLATFGLLLARARVSEMAVV